MSSAFQHRSNPSVPTGTPRRSYTALRLILLAAFAMTPQLAEAQQFQVHVEPAAAIWLDTPQTDRLDSGFYLAVRPAIAFGPIFSLQLSWAMLMAPAAKGFSEDGGAQFALLGFRLRPLATLRPESEQLGGLFIDANAGYVRTGDLDRFGFDTGLGYNFQIGDMFAMGPVLRYNHIVQPDDAEGQGGGDAQFMTAGLSFSFGPAHREPVEESREPAAIMECPEDVACEPVDRIVTIEVPTACPDDDRDGLCDDDDHCPAENGPPATMGCPPDPCTGRPLVVIVQFDYDSATMPDRQDEAREMDPVLDSVARAMAQDNTCRVCITGYASDEGADAYNEVLSLERADAVQSYLTRHGLSESRMPTQGVGATCQLVPAASRVMNRRVEFQRLEEGESCTPACAE